MNALPLSFPAIPSKLSTVFKYQKRSIFALSCGTWQLKEGLVQKVGFPAANGARGKIGINLYKKGDYIYVSDDSGYSDLIYWEALEGCVLEQIREESIDVHQLLEQLGDTENLYLIRNHRLCALNHIGQEDMTQSSLFLFLRWLQMKIGKSNCLTQQNIADFCGVHRTSVTSTLSRWRKKGKAL